MIRLLIVALLTLSGASAAAEGLEPKNTWAVVSGVLSWPDRGLASFPKEHRKDEELFERLGTMGVPIAQRRLLIDAEATTERIVAALKDTVARAPRGSTLVFYYAGHGLKDKHGEVVFASVDTSTARAEETGLHLDDLVPILAGFKGKRVILLADCCYSGGLELVASALAKTMNVVALTSAEASNTSTGNWTFTQAVIDALRGSDLSDVDGDGAVELGELAAEVAEAMKYREQQRSLYRARGVSDDLVLAKTVPDPATEGRLEWVLAPRPGKGLTPARVIAARGKDAERQVHVSWYDYSDESRGWVDARATRPLAFKTWPVGATVTVTWNNVPYEARVLAVEDGFMKITYPGWDATWDEWLTAARVVSAPEPATKALQVEWQGQWYEAEQTGTKGKLTCVHYVGYDASWDECVAPERVRR